MAANGAHNEEAARALAALRVLPGAPSGWSAVRHLRTPLFLKALVIYTIFGMIVGVLYGLYHAGRIPFEIKDLHVTSSFLVVFGGGLYIHGELTARRAALLALAAAINQTWLFFMWDEYPWSLLNVFVGGWLPLWWAWANPDLMARFGLRRATLGRDLLVALVMAALVMAYLVPVFAAYGYAAEFKADKVLSYAANALPMNLLNYAFLFSIWNALERRGISRLESMAALLAMLLLQQGFTWAEMVLTGFLPPGMAFGGMAANIMLLVLTFGYAFRVFRNTLPAVFIVTAIQLCVVMIGMLE
jgi:hypothetical protein